MASHACDDEYWDFMSSTKRQEADAQKTNNTAQQLQLNTSSVQPNANNVQDINQNSISTEFEKAKTQFINNNLDVAQKLLRLEIRNNPKFACSYSLLIKLLFIAGKHEVIDQVIACAFQNTSKQHAELSKLCDWYRFVNDFGRELELRCKMLKVHPECVECAFGCMRSITNLLPSKAINIVDCEFNHQSLRYLNRWLRGLIEKGSGNISRAEELLKQSVHFQPSFYLGYHSLFQLMQLQERYKDIQQFCLQSLPDIKAAFNHNKQNLETLFHHQTPLLALAYFFLRLELIQKAKKMFIYFIRMFKVVDLEIFSSQEKNVYMQIGKICQRQGFGKAALIWFRKCQQAKSFMKQAQEKQFNLLLMSWLALTLSEEQSYEEAKKLAELAKKLAFQAFSPPSTVFLNLFIAFDKLKDYRKIIQIYQQFQGNLQQFQPGLVYVIIAYQNLNDFNSTMLFYEFDVLLRSQNFDVRMIKLGTIYRFIDFFLPFYNYQQAKSILLRATSFANSYAEYSQCDAKKYQDLNEIYRLKIEKYYNVDAIMIENNDND